MPNSPHIFVLWACMSLAGVSCNSSDSQLRSTECLMMNAEAFQQICFVAHRGENLAEAIAAIKQTGHKQHYPQLDHELTLLEGLTTAQGESVSGTFYRIGFVDRQTGHLIHDVSDVVSDAGDHYSLEWQRE